MNDVIRLIKQHTSIREFNDTEISVMDEDLILDTAMRGATAGNMMSYSIIRVRSKEILEKLARSCDSQPFIAGAGLALLFVVDNYKWHRFFELRGILETFKEYKGPVINDMILGMQDAVIAAQNAVIAAESLGIGTCYIGDIMENYEYHKELFHLPPYTMPAILVVMGHYGNRPKQRERFDKAYVVFEDTYPEIDTEFVRNMFAREESKTQDFAERFYKRKMDAPFFAEMERSLRLYLREWGIV